MTAARDECVVDSEPLAELVTGFVSSWSRSRPSSSTGRFAGKDGRVGSAAPMSALDWLEAETKISRGTISNLIGRPRNRTTELRVADALVAAIGHPEVFHDSTLTIRQNPYVKRRSCCSGSLTGDA